MHFFAFFFFMEKASLYEGHELRKEKSVVLARSVQQREIL